MFHRPILLACLALPSSTPAQGDARPNVLLIVSDDLTATALSCYGSEVSSTPNIDSLAERGVRFTGAFCQATYCGPSRASFLTGYYPHATGVLGYTSPRPAIGERTTWPEHFRRAGYHTARVSKIYHMGVPGEIESGSDGADDPRSWDERFNSPGPEWRAPGDGETLEGNPDGTRPVVGGNTFVVVAADGDDEVHSDGRTAARAVELLGRLAGREQPFFLAVGFVRPHVPFVAPRPYHEPFLPYEELELPPKHELDLASDWRDTPRAGVNYKTSANMQMDLARQRKALGGYLAAVRFLDAQVGKVLTALRDLGLEEDTLVVFTSDHGFHLGEHDFWAKVSLRDESSRVPLLIAGPGIGPGVCDSLVELLDLYPTTASLCGLEVPARLQGLDLSPLLADPARALRQDVFCVAPMREGFLLRTERWAYLQYGEDASRGRELYDLASDPGQFVNLALDPDHADRVAELRSALAARLAAARDCDLAR